MSTKQPKSNPAARSPDEPEETIEPVEETPDAVDEAISATVDPTADWEAKAREYMAGWQRAQADYQNLQKDTAARLQSGITYATESFLQELLPMVDHFDYAFQAIPADVEESSWLKGIQYIYSNFLKILEAHGVVIMEVVGQPFDPARHEAIEEVPADDEHPSGTVVSQLAAGFLLHDKVIRCAKVKVAK